MVSRAGIQKFGGFLTGMVLPNIGAFIAWGLITAFFIPTGWYPNAHIAKMVGPMIMYLLPLLIAYTGGHAVAGVRGGVMGTIAGMGVIIGSEIPMFMGAMILGPLGGYIIKKFDAVIEGKIPSGFEMLVNNFSIGIIGMAVSIAAYLSIGPAILALNDLIKSGIEVLVAANLLPLLSLFNEPAKVLFLNNAIDQGIYGPLGVQVALEHGKSIFFMVASSPGPGLGLLLAYWAFGKGISKESAPTAILIHFFGGIHELYFPYVLMKPIMLIPMILGGMSGIITFQLLDAGLVAFPSPGSVISFLLMTPKGGYIATIAGVAVGAVVSFSVSSIFLKMDNKAESEDDFEVSKARVRDLKGKKTMTTSVSDCKMVVYACDAGMGSSAMGASTLRNKFKQAGINIQVMNCAIEAIPADTIIVVTHEKLVDRVRKVVPDAEILPVRNYLKNAVFEILQERYQPTAPIDAILKKENVVLGLKSCEKDEAIRMAGRQLVKSGYVGENYVEAMVAREKELCTYIGEGVAIPHGIASAKKEVKKSGIVILQFPEGIHFEGQTAHLLIGIAGVGDTHLNILANIASVVEAGQGMEALWRTTDVDKIYELFTGK